MNKIMLSFKNSQKQNQFLVDQLPMLTFFYERVCIFGSISAIIIFSLEFIYPIGFGKSKYFIICLPLVFLITFKLIKKHPKLFNYIIPFNNLLVGIIYNVTVLFELIPDLNLMIGQTVVLVQFSLLLGSNFALNMAIIIFNFTTLVLVQTIVQDSFNGNQVMLILALILSCLSYYSNEYQKREFFLLKQRNEVQYGSLIEQFGIQVFKVKYDRKTNFLRLESQNQTTIGDNFSSQEDFRKFIRQILIPKQQRSAMIQSKISSSKLRSDRLLVNSQAKLTRITFPNLDSYETLEQVLHKSLTAQKSDNFQFLQGYDFNQKCDYKIKILHTIEKGEAKAIVLLQQNEIKKEFIKVKQQRDCLRKTITQFQKLFEIRIKQMSSLITPRGLQQKTVLLSEVNFRLLQFISEYFSICISKNDIPKLKISTINILSLIQQIESPLRDYLNYQQIKLTYQTEHNLIITNNTYLITHLILSLLCFLIEKSPLSITLIINQKYETGFKLENVDEVVIKINAQYGGTIKKNDDKGNQDYWSQCDSQFGQEITFEGVIFKNLSSFKASLSKL
ncbi:unnamed protein product [Paramecium octaurelia]|uniref:Transmembrane protein n=1 Tax=Paramecium octaurelia TaxID=43137 RepID=A0A8S1VQL2_PAROT|nr:unnamed protein product [Paramecium octaurelia]